MKSLAYTIPTTKSFDDVVAAIEHNTAAHGFRVLHVHDIAAALAEKGFQREPHKIIEICNAKYAHDVLDKEPTAALMLPCPIVVYQQDGEIKISTMLPSVIADLLPGKGLEFTAELVEFALLSILNDSVEEPVPLPVS
jgi:uncharacterized protein (DUF302 family)